MVRSAFYASTVLSLSVVDCLIAEETPVQRALRDVLPKYEAFPTATSVDALAAVLPKETARAVSRKNVRKRVAVPPPSPADGIVLPEVAVAVTPLGTSEKRLPRTDVSVVQATIKIDSFATAAYRDEQLMKRHLSAFDRTFLNRIKIPLIGESNVDRARNAEAIYQSALGLGGIADQIELPKSPETNADDEKKTEEMYFQLYYSRPR